MFQSRASVAAVLVLVAILISALYFLVATANADLLNLLLFGCGSAVVGTVLWLVLRVRAIRRTRRLMKLVRPAWL
jgi:hypothetical protein